MRCHVMQTDEVLTIEPCVYEQVMLCYVMLPDMGETVEGNGDVFGCCCSLVGKK